MAKFKVWCPDDGEEPGEANIEIVGAPREAAEEWSEREHAALDYPEEIEVCVRDERGYLRRYTVDVEEVRTFTAVRHGDVEPPPGKDVAGG